MNDVLKCLERQLLIFSAAVAVIASTAFLFGGCCAVWQWYAAGLVALWIGSFGSERRVTLRSSGCFILVLGILWGLSHTMITRTWIDASAYHLPATRLLVERWNPVLDSTPEKITAFGGLQIEDARFLMIMAMPKVAWVFNAVAAAFTCEVLNLFYPLFFVLALALGIHIWLAFREYGSWVGVLAVAFALSLLPPFNMPVDVAVAVGGIGLLVSMWLVLKGERPDWIAFFCFSFWLSASKQTGALQCGVMWLVFAALTIRSWVRFRQYALLGVVLAVAWISVSVAPFYTTWRNYGHPLYPCYTVDEAKYPVQDVVSDFKVQNDDAASMGYLGRFANAYVSSGLTRLYYRIKTGQRDFCPQAQFFGYGNADPHPTTPTSTMYKVAFCSLLVLIMAFGRRPDRWAYMIGLAALFTVPKLMVGYGRYVPWLFWLGLLAIAISSEHRVRFVRRSVIAVVACSAITLLAPSVLNFSILVDQRYTAEKALAQKVIRSPTALSQTTFSAVGALSARAYGLQGFEREAKASSVHFYTEEFCVDATAPKSYYQRIQENPSRTRRLLGYPLLMLRSIPEFFILLFS